MEQGFDIQAYMTRGVERVVGDIVKATFKNPKESAYMAKFALASRAASRKRRKAENAGEHIPAFLIASITSQCNLHCAGCYSRCNHATVDAAPVRQLTAQEWLRIFDEADELGVSFILLAGGEPMIRRDVMEAAGTRPNILFPVFTNGTFMDERYFGLFDRCRNLVPVMSIEGEKEATDARRGAGVSDRLFANMDELHRRGLVFGASVTVTTRNIREVSSASFLRKLSDRGCRAVIFVEFVPVTDDGRQLAPGKAGPAGAAIANSNPGVRPGPPAALYLTPEASDLPVSSHHTLFSAGLDKLKEQRRRQRQSRKPTEQYVYSAAPQGCSVPAISSIILQGPLPAPRLFWRPLPV